MKKLKPFQYVAQMHIAKWQNQHLNPIMTHVSLSYCLLPDQTSILKGEHSL